MPHGSSHLAPDCAFFRRAFPVVFFFFVLLGVARSQTITTPPQSQTASVGGSVTFSVAATGAGLTYQWRKDGAPIAGATSATLNVTNIQPQNAGIYTAVVSSGATSASASAILGFTSTAKVTGAGTEVGADIAHPTGNIYDQILLQGPAAAVTADQGQVTRISYIDLNDDIVQVEFAGPGTLTLLLDSSSGPAPPARYFQANVSYMKGHASIVIAGATEATNVSVFSVGRGNAVNQALFRPDVTYDGRADIAYVAMVGGNGKFGGLRSANASYFATTGFTGVYAPGVQFSGPIFVHEIDAFDTATPVLLVGSASDVRITGGDLRQTNARPVQVSGFTSLNFVNGSTSHFVSLATTPTQLIPAKTNQAVLQQNGVDVTAQLVPRPNSSIYFAQLRPGPNTGTSTASGYAAISIVDDNTALVSVNISNLSSAQTSAYLRLSGTGDPILSLPRGQVAGTTWVIGPVGIYTRNDIVRALNEGRMYISLETANYPAGEVTGALLTSAGSQTFTAPSAPPVLNPQILSSPSDVDAARLLIQATFGPTDATIADVKRLGVTEWIKAQIAVPASSLLATMRDDGTRFPSPLTTLQGQSWPRLNLFHDHPVAWWKIALTGSDQLRQRVAFALSEIFVIASEEDFRTEPFAHYHDMLAAHAFGNFRTLIEKISTHPEMGWYLTFLRNQKADPVKGTSPDENYAREVQQLFTVGLVQLQPDGTLLLDSQGRPIPTYDNITITETAKVFTGWAYQNKNDGFYSDPAWDGTPGGFTHTTFYSDSNGRLQPLKCYEAFHDQTEKRVISLQQLAPRVATPTIIPAGQTGPADLKILLDTLFNHPNTGPFIAKQLIQRLVTSNPSAAYVYRVARVFANNGSGVRGDLGAVVTAILTDYEARAPEVSNNQGYGKIKEPLLRLTGLMRILKTAAPNGRFLDSYYYDPRSYDGFWPTGFFGHFDGAVRSLGQAAYHSPSVFNFFSPYYSAPGPLADAGLVAPEMQITDSTLAIAAPNQLTFFIHREPPVIATAPVPSPFLRNDFSGLIDLTTNPTVLLDRVNLLLCGGQMSAAARAVILETLQAIPVVPPLANTATPTRYAVNVNSWNAALAAPKVAAFDPAGSFTMEMWICPTTSTGQNSMWLMGKANDTGTDPWRHFALTIRTDGAKTNLVTLDLSQGVPGSARGITAPNPVPVGAWSHVAGVLDGTTMRLYVNGQMVGQATALGPPVAAPTIPFAIGNGIRSNGDGAWTYFNGYVSQARFWNVARTTAQIAQAMNEAQPSDKTGLVAGWMLDEGSGLTAADYSGNNYSLQRAIAVGSAITWAATDGKSLDRLKTALHLTVASPDSALQK